MMNFVINGKPTSKFLKTDWPPLNIGIVNYSELISVNALLIIIFL